MNTIRILSLALLAGVGVGGAVWYIWGVVENLGVWRKQRAAAAEADALQGDHADGDQNENADSLEL